MVQKVVQAVLLHGNHLMHEAITLSLISYKNLLWNRLTTYFSGSDPPSTFILILWLKKQKHYTSTCLLLLGNFVVSQNLNYIHHCNTFIVLQRLL
jgi:hypothetical protein